jgi:hypothetical protein
MRLSHLHRRREGGIPSRSETVFRKVEVLKGRWWISEAGVAGDVLPEGGRDGVLHEDTIGSAV